MATTETPLDEIQWRHPQMAAMMQGIHSNSVLFYFAESPFFDRTSNNATLANQALFNMAMRQYIETREAFEARLRTMAGIEYVVAQEPSSMAPGTGTGVWVIRKQVRRKRDGQDDNVTPLASYYVVGDNIYMAPTLADILSFRMTTVTSALRKCFPAAEEARTWSPASGHSYKLPANSSNPRERTLASKEATPMPDHPDGHTASQVTPGEAMPPKATQSNSPLDPRLAEQSFDIHYRHGTEFMDENPITGGPGAFHLSSTGRKERAQLQALNTVTVKPPTVSSLSTDNKRDGAATKSGDKTPKTPTSGQSGKKGRRKSKAGATPNSG